MVRAGDIRALARLITLIESGDEVGLGAAGVLVDSVDPVRRIGFTGPPGAGKSTLVDAVLTEMRSRGD
jgi:LAO/AO transport system kinase